MTQGKIKKQYHRQMFDSLLKTNVKHITLIKTLEQICGRDRLGNPIINDKTNPR